jgi:tetratricopeptide (TPR) repeat protein
VSVNPPTHFPAALTIIRRLVEAIAPDDAAREKLLSLADSGRSDKRHPGDYIRFESLLETIRFADPDLSLLEFVDLFDAPNPLHLYLAKQASLGNVVITTNFDNLIEESVLALGHKPLTVCRFTEYDTKIHYTPPEGRVPVYKLHGSYWQYEAAELRTAIETIQATLGTVAAGLTDLILPEAKRSFLSEMTEGSRMIVAGYSGGDDLDIMPAFYNLEPSSLTWLIHDGSLAGMKDITEQMRVTLSEAHEDELPARDLFFKTFMRTRPGLLRIFAGNTMQMLLGDLPRYEAIDKRLPGKDSSTTSFEQFITNWQSRFLHSDHVKHIIVGHLMMRLGRFDEAHQAYVQGHDACDAKTHPERFATTAAMVSRSAVELGLNKEALAYAECAVRCLPLEDEPLITARCLHQYGAANYWCAANYDVALEWYGKCAAFCREHKEKDELKEWLSYSLHDMALIHQVRCDYEKAKPLYQQSIKLSSAQGDLHHVAFSWHQLGTLSYDQGLFVDSKEYHLQSLRIATAVGDFAEVGKSEHELGMLDFLAGNLQIAVRRFRKSIRIANRTGRWMDTGMDWQHIAIVFMECGKMKAAARSFTEAERLYIKADDKETIAELYAYLAQYHLEKNEPALALENAWRSLGLAEASGVKEFVFRAEFMIGLSQHQCGDTNDSIGKITRPILSAREHGIKALLLDQIYLCARYNIVLEQSSELAECLKWVMDTYKELGNSARLAQIKRFSEGLTLT